MFHVPFSKSIKNKFDILQLKKELAKNNWFFNKSRLELLLREYEEWKKVYLPINIKNKVVLDIGSGECETAWFFILNGAKKVICIDNNMNKYSLLNAKNHKEIQLIEGSFNNNMLNISHDFLKVDIEGYEECLLNYDLIKPSVIEIHGLQLVDKFKSRGFRIVDLDNNMCVRYGFWLCN